METPFATNEEPRAQFVDDDHLLEDFSEADEGAFDSDEDNRVEPSLYVDPPEQRSFPTYEEALQSLTQWSKEHGFDLKISATFKTKHEPRLVYKKALRCSRSGRNKDTAPVSYTHLTLPTIYSV